MKIKSDLTLNVLKIETGKDELRYQEIVSEFKFRNPFNSLQFIRKTKEDNHTLHCFVLNKSNVPVVLMPVYLRPVYIEGTKSVYKDATSPYGYSGPMYDPDIDNESLDFFWKEVDNWYIDNDVITEFVRFNLDYNYRCYTGYLDPSLVNVRGKLRPIDDIWENFKQKVRNNVRRALKNDLRFEIFYGDISPEILSTCRYIYIRTMERNLADEKYFFSESFFKKFELLAKENPKNCAIAFVYKENTPISTEIMLLSERSIYSYLGGTESEYFGLRPNDFLKYSTMKWGHSIGKKYYVLGGGRENKDGLYAYKKSFYPKDQNVLYYTGRKVINEKVYRSLISDGNDLNDAQLEHRIVNTYFPAYRANE